MQTESLKEKLEKAKEEQLKYHIEYWNSLTFFNEPEDIPELPQTTKEKWENFYIPHLLRCGAIPKEWLEAGAEYIGTCRNADRAIWKGDHFEYERYKFGSYFTDRINHFQDDDGYDLFVPIKKVEK